MLREDLLLAAEDRIRLEASAKQTRDNARREIEIRAAEQRQAATQKRIEADSESERQRDCDLEAAKEQRDAETAQVQEPKIFTIDPDFLRAHPEIQFTPSISFETDARATFVSEEPSPSPSPRAFDDDEDFYPPPPPPQGPLPPFTFEFSESPDFDLEPWEWIKRKLVLLSLFVLILLHVGVCFLVH